MNPAAIIDLSHPLVEPLPCYPGDPSFKMILACSIPVEVGARPESATSLVPSESESGRPVDSGVVITVHELSLSTHTGTHIDAPFHFFSSGQKLHEVPLAQFVGRAVVLDVRHLSRERGRISWADITGSIRDDSEGRGAAVGAAAAALSRIGPRADGKADIVILWTGWESRWGSPAYYAHPYFLQDVATALCDLGVKIVGVDLLSPDETPGVGENAETKDGWGMHGTLLGHGVLICENLRGISELTAGDEKDSETWVGFVPLSLQGADGAPVRAFGWKQPR